MNIYALTLLIMLSQDTVQISGTTYHSSIIECQRTAQIIAKEYYLKENAVKVYAQCKLFMGI